MSKYTIKSLLIIITDQTCKLTKNVATQFIFTSFVLYNFKNPPSLYSIQCYLQWCQALPKKGTASFLLFALSSLCKKAAAAHLTHSQNLRKLLQLFSNGIFRALTNTVWKCYPTLNLFIWWQAKFREMDILFGCACKGKRAFLNCAIDCSQTGKCCRL